MRLIWREQQEIDVFNVQPSGDAKTFITDFIQHTIYIYEDTHAHRNTHTHIIRREMCCINSDLT